jgi:CheY-like chemotaxis protein
MKETDPILIATADLADGELVKTLLDQEFANVTISATEDAAVADFEQHRPVVLVLAFDKLEEAERYYLGLYRLSPLAHTLPHYTIILCNGSDLWHVYDLCKKQHFDDYVLFWPVTNDAPRLRMAVHHALRQRRAVGPEAVTTGQLVAQARRVAELEAQLEGYAAESEKRIGAGGATIAHAEQAINRALDAFSEELSCVAALAPDGQNDPAVVRRAIDRIKTDEVGKQFRSVAAAVDTLGQWAGGLKQSLAPQLESARALKAMADQIRPLVLVVDDDEFQHTLLRKLLAEAKVDLIFATTGIEALATLRRHRPDLILMDVELPDLDGLEATRRLKAIKHLAAIPIIMITGHSEKSVVVEAIKAGAAGFVVKPFDKAALLAKVRNTVQLSAAE